MARNAVFAWLLFVQRLDYVRLTIDPTPKRATIARRFSSEATWPKPEEIAASAARVPAGTEIYLTAVPAQTQDELVTAARNVRRAGLEPVVHVAARRLESMQSLTDLLAHLNGEADLRRLLVIGGDVDPVGPFSD